MSYWEDEAVERMLAIEEGAVSTTEEMIELYEQALDDIDDEIRKIRYNFQKRFGLDEETANYFLDTEQQKHNLENTVKAMESAPDDAARMNLLEYLRRDGLSIRAYSAREERFNSLKQVIHLRVKALSTDATRLLTDALKEVYKESYYTLIDNAAKKINAGMNFTVLADDAIEQAITAKWKGARFSERIWKRTDELSARAQKIVVKGMISGASEQKLSKELAAAFDVSEFQAATLVRTETNHAHAIADLQAYNDLGVEKYLYIASLDERTCEICQSLDGEIFNVSEAREGENYPTMHPRCRCVTSINLDLTSRAARNPITGKTYETDGFVSYKQWKESMTDEERSALDLAVKKNKNKSADSAQYEQYKSVLGTKNVGRSLDKFQELKYTDSEKWRFVKLDYSRRNELINNPSLALPNAAKATADNRKFTEYLFGGSKQNGLAKGAAFTSRLGYDADNYAKLKKEILSGAERYPAVLKNKDEHGYGYEQKMVLYGVKGTPANVIVGWKEKDGKTWLTSAYIKEIK